jgi:hypothetical protein
MTTYSQQLLLPQKSALVGVRSHLQPWTLGLQLPLSSWLMVLPAVQQQGRHLAMETVATRAAPPTP